MKVLLLSLLWLAQVAPLIYWGPREPLIDAHDVEAPPEVARVLTVHGALDAGDLVLRFDLDRTLRRATQLPDGTPVSGRLQARLYVDSDADPATGLNGDPLDPRVGAERLIRLGAVYMGADEEEPRAARVLIQLAVDAVGADGSVRALWTFDHETAPERFALHRDWLEARVPAQVAAVREGSRFVYAAGAETREGRLRP